MKQAWELYWNRGITCLILLNLILVAFDLSYVAMRGLYLQYAPGITQRYDALKGIEPHPLTQTYLTTTARLERSVIEHGLDSAETTQLLADLRSQSRVLITEDPYSASDQQEIFAKLKRRMRGYMGTISTQDAFAAFWQANFLEAQGWDDAHQFFVTGIQPLLEQNYYRQTLPTGQFVDEFWRIDIIFIVIFGSDFLFRTWLICRRREHLSWGDAIARRWYEVPLLLPFWRWLRVFPAVIRLHRSGLLNVERAVSQITHEPAAYLSDRVSRFALVRVIQQAQDAVQSGNLLSIYAENGTRQRVGDAKKLERLSDRLLQVVIYSVMPSIKPELQDLLNHSLEGALKRSDLYDQLQQLPGWDTVPSGALDSLSQYLAQATCDVLADSYRDVEGQLLVSQLAKQFRIALTTKLQDQSTSEELQSLLTDWLEEVKLNSIQKANQYDPEATLEAVEEINQKVEDPVASDADATNTHEHRSG